jgi:N-acetylneuraminic acid mutarotase
MRFDAKFQLLVILAIPALFLTACNNTQTQSIQPLQTYTIGGTAVNLAANGGGLVLQDNGGDNLIVNANGSFQFPTALASGSSYKVTVLTQPSSPSQTCGVTSGTGTAMAEVTNVQIDCGHNEWSWQTGAQAVNQIGTYGTLGAPGASNTPGGRQFPATWTDASGNLWLFGGYGYDSDGTFLPFNDLWKFSGGQWTWMGGPSRAGQNGNYGTLGVAAASNIPGARTEASSWTDTSGNFWLFGGIGFDSVGNESPMNDLWKYSGGQWTWIGGSSVGLQHGTYGTLGVPDENNAPGGRNSAVTWMDASGSIWVFGGIGYDELDPVNGELNDFWKYSGGQWTWMGGPKIKQQPGVYGTQGIAAAGNIPGARLGAFGWADANGNFWVFGGFGYDSNGSLSILNDQWKYSGGQWTWVGGSNVVNQLGVYGTQGIAAANNIPGARQYGVTWTDSSGNAWIFGGNGMFTPVAAGQLNDLWKFSGGQWTWVGGSQTGNQTSTYGTQGSLAPGNTPGGRLLPTRWIDVKGNLWLFGGYGESAGAVGNLNDLWMYMP